MVNADTDSRLRTRQSAPGRHRPTKPSGVNSAFGFGSPTPPARARVFACGGPAGAWHAPDRQKARRRERMRRQVCELVDRIDLFARDVCKRIEFQPGTVLLDHRNVGAESALKALPTIDPGA